MCGRYTLSKAENLKLMLREADFIFDEFSETALIPRFNIARRSKPRSFLILSRAR